MKVVAVIGASNDRRKFGNRAVRAFKRQGYTVIPINAALTQQAQAVGVNVGQFTSCLNSGRHKARIQASVSRMEGLGIQGTPMALIGYTPAPGQPMKVEKYLYGALPFADFKSTIDGLLASK